MNSHMTARDSEPRNRRAPARWSDDGGPYDQATAAAMLDACGPGPFASALELGGPIGAFTELLAQRCATLTRIDISATAASMARRRLADLANVEVLRGPIPDAIPERKYDLVVASDILYYLPPADFERTLAVVGSRLVADGRLVAVHWPPEESERPFTADEVHARLRDVPWLEPVRAEQNPDFLIDLLKRR